MLPGKDLPCHKEAATGYMELGSMPDCLLDNETKDVVVDASPLVPKDGQEAPSDTKIFYSQTKGYRGNQTWGFQEEPR